jgi:hypothetical protein
MVLSIGATLLAVECLAGAPYALAGGLTVSDEFELFAGVVLAVAAAIGIRQALSLRVRIWLVTAGVLVLILGFLAYTALGIFRGTV